MKGQVFTGNVSHTLDPKGRATIPVAYRGKLGDNFTVGINSEGSAIALYPQDYWEKIAEALEYIPSVDARAMKYKRLILAFSFTDNQLDGQGRVLLAPGVRERTGIDKAIRFVGVGAYLEIWNEEAFLREADDSLSERMDLLAYVSEKYHLT